MHKQSSDVLYAELLQLVVNHSKALAKIDKMESRIKQEKTASKSHQKHISLLESDIITENADQANIKALQKLLDGKDKVINDLKENLKIPPTQVLQTRELAEVETEKDQLQQRILFLHVQISKLKQENEALSEKLKHAENSNPLAAWPQEGIEMTTGEIVAAMSQVKLKDIQISELNLKIEKLKKADQGTLKIAELEGKVEELKQKLEDQEYGLTGRVALLGDRHLIWDEITKSLMEFRPYLDIMEDKVALSCKALHKYVVLNDTMVKRIPDIAQNAINLLKIVTNEQLHTLQVKDRITVIMWAKRVICKHNFANSVKAKAEEMRNVVHQMKNIFQPLFKINLPTFWNSLDKLIPATEYQPALLASRMDSSKLNELPGSLSGPTIVDRLSDDFIILHQFRNLREFMPPMSYTQCIELQILLKEMLDNEMLTDEQWKQVERLGQMKYNIAGSSAS